ncbi:MAG: DNRLRE domain-containing protein, partial [Bacilli bacterium]|nr:DNRLRE domain-containing protein [Bacilli bacterium]
MNIQNKWKKFLSFIVLIGMFCNYLPWNLIKISANSEPITTEVVEKEDYDSTTDSSFDIYDVEIVSEDITKRELSSKTFKKIDGTYEVALYNDVIHFNNHGELEDIDNRLVYDEETKSFVNKNNDIKVYFPQYFGKDKSITLSKEKYQINWNILNVENSEISYENSTTNSSTNKSTNIKELPFVNQALLYKSIQKSVDLEYVLSGNDVKENIIINEYIPDYSISFLYELNGLKLTSIDGNYIFMNEKNEVIFEFAYLFMIDKEDNMSDNVKIQVDEVSLNTYKVTLLPNNEWLKEAIYPIKIDPTITSGGNSFTINSTYVKDQTLNINYSNSLTMLLASQDAPELRGLLNFTIPTIVRDNIITYSYLTLTKYTGTTDKQINLYKNNENFDYTEVTWQTRPDFDPQIIDYHIIGIDNEYRFDITSVVKSWNEAGTYNTPGFTIQDTDYSSDTNSVYQGSVPNRPVPVLEIGYLEPGGIKDYWTYNSQSAGTAGTGYVCDLTGKLYFTRSDFNFATSKQSLGLTFIYSDENRYVNLGYGNGWQTNYHIRVYQDTSINQSSFYTMDGSGLKTHFIQTDTTNQYIAEDGSGNILTIETLEYIIKTKDNIEYYFDIDGYLYEIADLSKNREGVSENLSSIKIVRLSDRNKIDYIYDCSGNKIVFTYNSNMLSCTTLMIKQENNSFYSLERVNYAYTEYLADVVRYELNTVTYYKHYDTSSSLQLEDTINYAYDNDVRMVEANETNGAKLIYSYTDFKVSTIESFCKTYKFGELLYDYDLKKTTITNQAGKYIIYLFDDYGHTVNLLDSDGTAQFFRYLNLYKTREVGEVGEVEYNAIYTNYNGIPNYNNNHKLIEQSTPQNTIINPVVNHGFEYELNSVTSWLVDVNSGSYSDCIFEASDTMSIYGAQSGRIHVTNGATASLYQQITLDQGVHTISGYVRNNTASDNVYIGIEGVGISNIDAITSVDNDNDWHYVEIGFSVANDNTNVQIHLANYSSGGSAYFDNIQLVSGYQETRKNMVENASFETNGANPGTLMSWYLSTNTSIYDMSGENTSVYGSILGDQCIKVLGSADAREYALASLSQNLDIPGEKTLVIGGWAKSEGATPTTKKEIDRYFRINVSLFDVSNPTPVLVKQIYIDFDPSVEGWQYV